MQGGKGGRRKQRILKRHLLKSCHHVCDIERKSEKQISTDLKRATWKEKDLMLRANTKKCSKSLCEKVQSTSLSCKPQTGRVDVADAAHSETGKKKIYMRSLGSFRSSFLALGMHLRLNVLNILLNQVLF